MIGKPVLLVFGKNETVVDKYVKHTAGTNFEFGFKRIELF